MSVLIDSLAVKATVTASGDLEVQYFHNAQEGEVAVVDDYVDSHNLELVESWTYPDYISELYTAR